MTDHSMTADDAERSFQRGLRILDGLRFVDHQSEYNADQKEALAAFEQATRYAPDHAEAWLQMARSLTELGSHERALAAYTEILRHRPDDVGRAGRIVTVRRFLGVRRPRPSAVQGRTW